MSSFGGEGLLTLVSNTNANDFETYHMEACEQEKISVPMDKDSYEGNFSRYGDAIPYIFFQFKCPNAHPPLGFPFTCIKRISVFLNQTLIIEYTGRQMWCMIQTLPERKRHSIFMAAQRGIVMLKDFMPSLNTVSLPYFQTSWKIETDQQVYNHVLYLFRISQINLIADLVFEGITDLGQLTCLYANATDDRGTLTNYIPHIFVDPKLRDKMIKTQYSVPYQRYFYKEWDASQLHTSIDCTFRRALQFNFIVERKDNPNTFYTPKDEPIEEIIISCQNGTLFRGTCDEMYIMDKFVHDLPIPTNIAHYTHTYQSIDEYSNNQGNISFDGQLVKTQSFLNMKFLKSTISIQVKISPRIDPKDKICMWIVGAAALQYSSGCGSVSI